MEKERFHKFFNSKAERPGVNRLVTAFVTAGGAYLGGAFVSGVAPVVYASAVRGDMSMVGMISGGIAGFLVCASSLRL